MYARVNASASTMWYVREYSTKESPTTKSVGAKKSVAFFLGWCRLISIPCNVEAHYPVGLFNCQDHSVMTHVLR